MANPSVLIEIEAADKTKAATDAATKQVAKVGDTAKRSMEQAKAATESYRRELTAGLSQAFAISSAIIVGSIMLIKQAFEEVNASAERLGRTDITKATKTAADNVQLMLDKAQEAAGVYNIFANLSTLYAAFVKSVLINTSEVFSFFLKKVSDILYEIEYRINNVIDNLNVIGARLNLPAIPRITTQIRTLGDTALAVSNSLGNFSDYLVKLDTTADNAAKKMSKVKKETEKTGDALKSSSKTLYSGLISTLQGYLAKKKALETQGNDDTEDAIRNGDARALAQAKKARAEQIAQMEQDKKDALKNLVLGLIDTSTLAGAKKAAEFMGMGGEFNSLLKQFRADYGDQEIAGGTVGQAVSGKAGGTLGGQSNQFSVTVNIGNEQLENYVTTVIADRVFKAQAGEARTRAPNSKPQSGQKQNRTR